MPSAREAVEVAVAGAFQGMIQQEPISMRTRMTAFRHSISVRTVFLLTVAWVFGACDVAMAQDKHINVSVSGNKLLFQNPECPDRPNDMGCVLVSMATRR